MNPQNYQLNNKDCLTISQAKMVSALDNDVSFHLYFCCRCFLLFHQINPDYLKWLQNKEKEWERNFRQCLLHSDKQSYLLQIGFFGLPHLTQSEIVEFNLLEDDFDSDILVFYYEHLAECFRCRSRCRKLTYLDYRRVYPPRFSDLYVREIFNCYEFDADIIFSPDLEILIKSFGK